MFSGWGFDEINYVHSITGKYPAIKGFTTSILHTIELILGLPPMSQYDASAEPMWRCFSNQANLTPFDARPLQTNINSVNTVNNVWQRKSEGFDFFPWKTGFPTRRLLK